MTRRHTTTLFDEMFAYAMDDLYALDEAARRLELASDLRYPTVAARWVEKQDRNFAKVLNGALGMTVSQTSRKILPAHNGVHS